jgi:hypothetical protein
MAGNRASPTCFSDGGLWTFHLITNCWTVSYQAFLNLKKTESKRKRQHCPRFLSPQPDIPTHTEGIPSVPHLDKKIANPNPTRRAGREQGACGVRAGEHAARGRGGELAGRARASRTRAGAPSRSRAGAASRSARAWRARVGVSRSARAAGGSGGLSARRACAGVSRSARAAGGSGGLCARRAGAWIGEVFWV